MQNINSDLIRGNIDTIILKTMLGGDMYGLDIIREVENKSNGTYELKQPTLYSCLKRLENQGLISSYWLDSDIGGKRHYYKLTEKGHEVIKSKQNEWSKSKLLIDNLLGDFDNSEYRLVKKEDYDKIINGKPNVVYLNSPAPDLASQQNTTAENNNTLQNQPQSTQNSLENINAENDEIQNKNQDFEDLNDNNLEENSESTTEPLENENDISASNDTYLENNDFNTDDLYKTQINAISKQDAQSTQLAQNSQNNGSSFDKPQNLETQNSENAQSIYNNDTSHNLDYIDINNPNLKQQNLLNDFDNVKSQNFESNSFVGNSAIPQDSIMHIIKNDETNQGKFKQGISTSTFNSLDNTSNFQGRIKLEANPDPFDNEIIFLPKKNVNEEQKKAETEQKKSENDSSSMFKQSSAFDLDTFNKSLENALRSENSSLENQKKEAETKNKEQQKQDKKDDFIQQNIFENVLMPYQNEVDAKINEFNKNISKLNNFDYSGLNNSDENELSKTNIETNNLNIDQNVTAQNQASTTFDKEFESSQTNSQIDTENNNFSKLENNLAENNNFADHENSNSDLENKETEISDENIDPNSYSVSSFNYKLNELDKLSNGSSVLFDNDDGYDKMFEYQEKQPSNTTSNEQVEIKITEENANSLENADESNDAPPTVESLESSTKKIGTSNYLDSNFNYKSDAFDDIILKNATDYTNSNSRDYYSNLMVNYPEPVDEEYKNKVQVLSSYTKNASDAPTQNTAKDIQTLKEEYKNEGITIKQFSKTKTPANAKNYLMVNKLNLIKSFILMFGYVFVLSALYIILNNTSFKETTDFSFKYFIYGFIPFIVYTIIKLVMYFINPYKKVPARFSPRAMMFMSVIVTFQLLLFTCLFNMQMGFTSFTQIGYNHLLWIIPGLISFAPIVSTIIYGGLYRSKNFTI